MKNINTKKLKEIRAMLLKLDPEKFNMGYSFYEGCGCVGGYAERKMIIPVGDRWIDSIYIGTDDEVRCYLHSFLFAPRWSDEETNEEQLCSAIGRVDALIEGFVLTE